MRQVVFTLLLAGFFATASAAPKVSSVRIETADHAPLVTVAYTLDAEAVVTVRFLIGDKLVPLARSQCVGGDVNAKVSATGADEERTLYWSPDREDWGDDGVPGLADVKAIVTAWSPDAPPDYLVADLEATNCVRYYVSAEAVPGGVTNVMYKTSKMVFRKIPAQDVVWKMGLASGAPASYRGFRKNKLTADFYIGIYPVTQGQNRRFADSSGRGNEAWLSAADSPQRAVAGLYARELLGADDATVPTASSSIGKFRTFTGLSGATLPTEAQWEYACRGGSAEQAFWGSVTVSESKKYAWTTSCLAASDRHPQVVGLLLPNAYGLYDILGNVWECCLDFYGTLAEDTTNTVVDFVQTTKPDDTTRVMKGGSYANDMWFARTSYYTKGGMSVSWNFGYRMVIPLPAQVVSE